MDDKPEWVEAELRDAIKFTDPHEPGILCDACSNASEIPSQPRFKYLHRIFHSVGRVHP